MRDWRCAERGGVAAQESWEAGFKTLDAGLGCCCLGCGGSRLAGFGRLGPEEIGAWALLPDSGERAWEHDDCGSDVETVRVDVGLVEMTIGIGIGDGWRTTCEVGFVLADVCLPTYLCILCDGQQYHRTLMQIPDQACRYVWSVGQTKSDGLICPSYCIP